MGVTTARNRVKVPPIREEAVMQPRETSYPKSGNIDIAYRVVGSGSLDHLVFVPVFEQERWYAKRFNGGGNGGPR
jgi:hypothetical protein